eukprot:s3434_g1.t1
MSDGPLAEVWLGSLPHDPSALKIARQGLVEALADACGLPRSDIQLRCHTKGALENGEGLGFGYAWLPPKAAEALVEAGTVEYSSGQSQARAAVRASRGNGTRAPRDGAEDISVALASTFQLAHDADLTGLVASWQALFNLAHVRVQLRVCEKFGPAGVAQLLRSRKSLLWRLPLAAVLWRPEDVVSQAANESLIAAARVATSEGRVIMFLQAKEGVNCRELEAASNFQESLRQLDPAVCNITSWSDLKRTYLCAEEDPMAAVCAMVFRRAAASLWSSQVKVFVSDCDYTLWEGAVSEEGLHVEISGPYLELQRKLSELQKSGRLVCLASRNSSDEQIERLLKERASECALLWDQVVATEVHPGAKPESLRRLSEALDLPLEAFVFIDDNSFEIADVRRCAPLVYTLHVPGDSQGYALALQHWWVLDSFVGLAPTKEDARRTELYRSNAARRAEKDRHSSLQSFVASLEVRIDIREPLEDDFNRVSQISMRTNQFNTTQMRFSEQHVRSWCSSDEHFVVTAQVADKFGDYGLVAAAFCTRGDGILTLDCLALSCRVLHRGVEQSLLRELGKAAAGEGRQLVKIHFRASGKNDLARGFLARLHSWARLGDPCQRPTKEEATDKDCFELPVETLAHLENHTLQRFADEEDAVVPSARNSWAADAIDRESRVLTWTNVVDSEDRALTSGCQQVNFAFVGFVNGLSKYTNYTALTELRDS